MSETTQDPPYVAQFNVTPTRAQFDGACRRLEAHLAALKRIKLGPLDGPALAAEFVRFDAALRRYEEFLKREVSHFMRDWWRIDDIKAVDSVRRRCNRQRNLSYEQLFAIKAALVARGPAGIDALKDIFRLEDDLLVWWLLDVAVEQFPDDAEPVLVALCALPDEGLLGWHQRSYREALETIRGYRARRAPPLAPGLGGVDAGLAPALSTLDKSPAEFPALLFERFAVAVFTGEASFHAAINQAWTEVVAEHRLDPKYQEQAEFAVFDPKFRTLLAEPIHAYYGDGPYFQHVADHEFAYHHADGRPVTTEELLEGLCHVVRMTHEGTYAPAKAWRPGAR